MAAKRRIENNKETPMDKVKSPNWDNDIKSTSSSGVSVGTKGHVDHEMSPVILLNHYYTWIENHQYLPKFMMKELKQIASANHQATMTAIGAVELTYLRTKQEKV